MFWALLKPTGVDVVDNLFGFFDNVLFDIAVLGVAAVMLCVYLSKRRHQIGSEAARGLLVLVFVTGAPALIALVDNLTNVLTAKH